MLYEPCLPFAVGLVGLLALLRWGVEGRPTRPSPLNLPLILLLLTVTFSLAVTRLPEVALPQTLRLLAGVLLCISLINGVQTPARLAVVLRAFVLLSAGMAAAALLTVDWPNKYRFLPVLPAEWLSTINPNVMAGALLLLLSGLLGFLAFRWPVLRRAARIILVFAAAFLSVVIFLTQSRSALITLAAALALLILLRFRRGWIVVSLVSILAAALIVQAGPQQVWYSLASETGGTGTFTLREDIWLRAKIIIGDFPFTGVGMGAFGEVVDALYPRALQPVHTDHAHNLFLQIAVDLGLPGLAAWLACWVTVLIMAWKLVRNSDNFYRALGAALLCSQCALGVNGLLNCPTWDTRPAVLVWVLWGLTAAAWKLASPAPRKT